MTWSKFNFEGRHDVPEGLVPRAPDLDEQSYFVVSVFYDLTTCRSLSMGGVGYIPYTAMMDYCCYWNIVGEDAEMVIDVVIQLDRLYTNKINKK